ncbi:MAG TPA: DNA alkylation repair protein [Planctomycetota bacterium]|nr:DNA alkylation repair protein [Planctomycetota bacterium]
MKADFGPGVGLAGATRREVEEVRRRLRERADARAARLLRAGGKTPHRVIGVVPPAVREVARQVARRHRRDAGLSALFGVARALWRSPWHEERSAAIHMLAVLSRRLEARHWGEFKRWIGQARTAEHCDAIATGLLGPLVKRDRSWCRVLKHWARSRNPWERRAAAGAVFLRVRHMGDVEAGLEICEALMRDPSPVVQEGVGALLQEAQAVDARATGEFLERWRAKARPEILRAAGADPTDK